MPLTRLFTSYRTPMKIVFCTVWSLLNLLRIFLYTHCKPTHYVFGRFLPYILTYLFPLLLYILHRTSAHQARKLTPYSRGCRSRSRPTHIARVYSIRVEVWVVVVGLGVGVIWG